MSTKKLQLIGSLGTKIYSQNEEPTDAQDGALWIDLDEEALGASSNAVLYTAQSLTDEQKAQARENIGLSAIEPADDDIPNVFITGSIPTTKDEVLAEMEYISKTERFKAYLKIKCQGSSSMNYPKKNFTIKLYSDEARETKLEKTLKDWRHASSKFVLKANYIDHSHARNIVCANLWDEIVSSRADYDTLPEEMRNSPRNGAIDGFPIKLYANGTYQGIYTWNIGKDAWMWGMDEDNANHVLMCGENNTDGVYAETACNFRALWSGTDGEHWSVEVGKNSNAVKNSMNALIACVKDTDDNTFKAAIGNYLDVQSAIDYWIHQYVICGLDGLAKNMLLATYDGGKWICGAYDMDSTFGMWWNGTSFVSSNYRCPEDYQEQFSLMWERIANLYSEEITARYNELRTSVYSYANMVNRFERFTDIIGKDLYAEDLEVYTGIPSGSTNNIKQIRNFVRDRLAYCDRRFNTEVPGGYTAVAFVQSDGRQYIDTEISGGANAEYEILFDPSVTTAVDYEQYFGGDKNSAVPKIFHNKGNNQVQVQSTQINNNGSITTVVLDDKYHWGRIWKFSYTKDGKFKRFDTIMGETANSNGGFGWGDKSWYVFANHTEGLMSSMRLYGLKMWTDGELVRDFIPVVRNSDGVAGLYDKASGRFFESETDTPLTAFTGLEDEYRPSVEIPSGYVEVVFDENTDITIPSFRNNPSGENGMTHFEICIPSTSVVAPDILYPCPDVNNGNYVGSAVIYASKTWNDNNYMCVSLPTDIVGRTLNDVKTWLADHSIVFYVKST